MTPPPNTYIHTQPTQFFYLYYLTKKHKDVIIVTKWMTGGGIGN